MQSYNSKFKSLKEIKKELPGVQENIPLAKHTTFRIGGRAKYFFVVKTKLDLIKAIEVAKKLNLPFFILGGGSNLLVSDKGYDGLVIKMQNAKCKMQNYRARLRLTKSWRAGNSKFKIIVEAGYSFSKLVYDSVNKNLTGLEWASGIPGTIGGAVFGNAGTFQKSMKDITKTVTVLEIKNQKSKIKIFQNAQCKFGYRDSIFKRNKNLIILSAVFQLKKGKKKEIQKKIKEYLNYKKETQPLNYSSAGSVFKNPSPAQISPKFMAGKVFSAGELGEENKSSSSSFAAARLIEKCGLKGKRIGQAKISEKHANFIVNLGNARAKDVKKLINLIKKSVKKKFGLLLEEEIQYLGFRN